MHVSRLLTAPVKGLATASPEQVLLDVTGAVGDREFFCVDDSGTLVSIARTGDLCGITAAYDPVARHLALRAPDGAVAAGTVELGAPLPAEHYGRHVPGRRVAGPWDALLSEHTARPLRLLRVTGPRPAVDVHPVTLLSDASVQAVADAAGAQTLDPRRFRMLLGLGDVEPFAEDSWQGRRLRVGGAVLDVGGPVPRCVATQRDPDTGEVDVAVLAALTALRGVQPSELGPRGVNLGVYARVVTGGTVRVGDELELL